MRAKVRAVIPAEAGIQSFRMPWIPASAGMTAPPSAGMTAPPSAGMTALTHHDPNLRVS